MSAVGVVLFGNLPPAGRGVYARDQGIGWLSQFDFIALPNDRVDTASKAPALRSAGHGVWLTATPGAWTPDTDFEARIAGYEARIDSLGVAGAIADPEDGWRNATRAQAQAAAAAIDGSIGRGYRWGITSFPTVPFLDVWAGTRAWLTPQLYHPSDVARYAHWTDLAGSARCIPSVATYGHVLASPEYTYDASSYADYLASLPQTVGMIGWTTLGGPAQWQGDAYLAHTPCDVPHRVLFSVERAAMMPASWIVVGLLIATLILVLVR